MQGGKNLLNDFDISFKSTGLGVLFQAHIVSSAGISRRIRGSISTLVLKLLSA